MSRHLHTAYSLSLRSELGLPELQNAASPLSAEPDVVIRIGRAIEAPDEAPLQQFGPFLWARGRVLRLQIPQVADFLVREGREIVVEPAAGIDEASIRAFLLGSALGALLMQRGLLVLHGNAVRIGEQCMVCVGHSGAGKSTLAAAFARHGHALLADDVIPIDLAGCALPGIPRIKLWGDSAGQLGVDTAALAAVRPGLNKFNLPVGEAFASSPLPVRWVYTIGRGLEDRIELTPLRGMQRFEALQAHLYRQRFVVGLGLQREQLLLCSRLAGQVRMSALTRPVLQFDPDALVRRLLADMQQEQA